MGPDKTGNKPDKRRIDGPDNLPRQLSGLNVTLFDHRPAHKDNHRARPPTPMLCNQSGQPILGSSPTTLLDCSSELDRRSPDFFFKFFTILQN
jgi:hypothetical protein